MWRIVNNLANHAMTFGNSQTVTRPLEQCLHKILHYILQLSRNFVNRILCQLSEVCVTKLAKIRLGNTRFSIYKGFEQGAYKMSKISCKNRCSKLPKRSLSWSEKANTITQKLEHLTNVHSLHIMWSRSDTKVHKKIVNVLTNMTNMKLNLVAIGVMLGNKIGMSFL
jgi:hypothetical protein